MRVWYLSHRQAANALVSLRKDPQTQSMDLDED